MALRHVLAVGHQKITQALCSQNDDQQSMDCNETGPNPIPDMDDAQR